MKKNNWKIKIDEYAGKDIDNKDTYNTTGGTISTGGIGVEYHDKDSGHYNTFVKSVGLAGQKVDRVLDDMVESYNTIKDIMASGKSDEEKAKEIISQGMESILYYELVSPLDIEGYNNGKVSELVKNNPDFINEMEVSADKANDVLSVIGNLSGLDDINKVRQSEDYLKNLEAEVNLMSQIEELRKTKNITDDQARDLAYGLYSVMYPDLLGTKYLLNNIKIVEKASQNIVDKYGVEITNAINGNISVQDYRKLLNNINQSFIEGYGIKDLNSRLIDPDSDIYYKVTGDPGSIFVGVRMGALAPINKALTTDEKKELENQGYKISNIGGKEYIDFSEQREIWLNTNTQINIQANNPIYMAGTSGHEVGHDKDLKLIPKNKEERLLVKLFELTSLERYSSTDQGTPGYNLRGSELFQYELGNIIRVKISEELNRK